MPDNQPINTVLTQLQALKQSGGKLEISCSGKLRTFIHKMKEKLDAENFIYSEEDLLNGVKAVFLQREKIKRPKIDPTDKRVKCPNGPLQFIGPFSTTSATGESNNADRRLDELNKWGDQEMGDIIDEMMAEINKLMEKLANIGIEANVAEIMAQIPGLKGKPLNVLLEMLREYLEQGKKKTKLHDQKLSVGKGMDVKTGPSTT